MAQPPSDPYAFLSYAREDIDAVRTLYAHLDGLGYRVWFDCESLIPGQDWDHEIRKALRGARLVLACLSAGSLSKTGYVQRELREAIELAMERPRGQLYIVPVLLEPCDVPEQLRQLQWVELFSEDGMQRLQATIRATLGELLLSDLRARADLLLNGYLIRVLVRSVHGAPLPNTEIELNEIENRQNRSEPKKLSKN